MRCSRVISDHIKQGRFHHETDNRNEAGGLYLGATTYDGSFIYQRTWHRTDEVAFYGPMESTYKIVAHISYGVPIIQLFEDGRALGTRDYSSPKRAINAIREILRCAGYEL